MPMLHFPSHALAQGTAQASHEDDRLGFHTAYNAVGHGRSFVRRSTEKYQVVQATLVDTGAQGCLVEEHRHFAGFRRALSAFGKVAGSPIGGAACCASLLAAECHGR